MVMLYNEGNERAMLRVLAVVDKSGTAIDRLAQGVAKYIEGFEYVVVDVHPKRPDLKQLQRFEDELARADLCDWGYYRTAEMLRDKYPKAKELPSVLSHFNPYAITESNWEDYDLLVTCNKTIQASLKAQLNREVIHIPLAIDHEKFPFNQDWKPNNNVIMVANRIESKKGIYEVAKACENLNLNFILVGAISDQEYFSKIISLQNVTFSPQVTDEELLKLYGNATLHVCNSVDNFESGTMPILESMMVGVPVLTRNVGHVPDFYNGENLVLNPHNPDDIDELTTLIGDVMADKKRLESLREKGWQTAKNFTARRRALMYARLFRRLQSDVTPVSIVLPITDWDAGRKSLNAIAEQDYPNIEVVVCDDGDLPLVREVADYSAMVPFPVQYHYTGQGDYGLARARNIGTIKATGDIIVYCDQRQVMDKDAVSEFVNNLVPRQWLFGNKGGGKKDFVENFSCIYRDDIIRAGMFSERCDKYGSMSQESRARTRAQGIVHTYVESAKATPTGKSSNKYTKRSDIIDSKDMLWAMGL